jgi:hypothetical protein
LRQASEYRRHVQAPAQELLTFEFMSASTESRDKFKHNLAAEILRNTGVLRLSAFGSSMLPTLWPGDLLTIQACSIQQMQVGDVVLFAREDRFFIHRITTKFEQASAWRVVTRGDAMPTPDAPVSHAELLGKVVTVQRDPARNFPVPACSYGRRSAGLLLAYSSRLRSLALGWHAWRSRVRAQPDSSPEQA